MHMETYSYSRPDNEVDSVEFRTENDIEIIVLLALERCSLKLTSN
jgi:hypothetical protein